MTAYYNEHDPFAAAWLRNLIAAGHIAPGVVDERSILDVVPDELMGYTQCHFFAGIGVWSRALRLAGWPDDRPVWTGSCPCQPFSAAGRRGGASDERHLWPAWFHLIQSCRPDAVYGEQVASEDGLAWLDLVLSDLEGAAYAAGAVDLCAAGFGASHIRQRLWLVAHAHGARSQRGSRNAQSERSLSSTRSIPVRLGDSSLYGDREHPGKLHRHEAEHEERPKLGDHAPKPSGPARVVADADGEQWNGSGNPGPGGRPKSTIRRATNGFWRDVDWLFCRDGKWRPVEPGTFPLAHGAPARVGRLRGYGNAICAPVAAEVIRSSMEEMAHG